MLPKLSNDELLLKLYSVCDLIAFVPFIELYIMSGFSSLICCLLSSANDSVSVDLYFQNCNSKCDKVGLCH